MNVAIENIEFIERKKLMSSNSKSRMPEFTLLPAPEIKKLMKEIRSPLTAKQQILKKWIMPPQPEKYIKARENDCL